MSRLPRFGMILVASVVIGSGGYRALAEEPHSGAAHGAAAGAAHQHPHEEGRILYYRHPDGLPQFSAQPKSTDDGRPYMAVREKSAGAGEHAPAVKSAAAMLAELGPTTSRRILYYRNPMGLGDTSPVPKKDNMGMDYVPVFADEQQDGATIRVSPGRLQRTGVKTSTAAMARIGRAVRAPATVTLDETRVSVISMRTDAFIDTVSTVTTGDRIEKGQMLFGFYAKEIATAGTEYAAPGGDRAGSALRLKNLGVPDEAIRTIAERQQVPSSIDYASPRDGIVLERFAIAGMMAKPGDVLFRIADMSHLWVLADLPEYDLASVRVGADVRLTVRSLPGRSFEGTVDLIYPQVDAQTRTTKVRIELPNPDGVLLVNMYAEVEIDTRSEEPVIAVPNSAVIDTGDRRLVFLDKGEGRFEPRDVTLGARGDGQTEIVTGIKAGDQVVVAANFLLDAESNLNSALSAMTAEGGKQ
ncbi:efflux RND transporter periplasmic adaptor subunit [Rhizobium wenxiniae]|uniref:efflux RND transporter periplasmic adaptor subunit n=1 Tax=Rhizobium wenxiniae TaxID=1737357 RepID=UPI003C29A598